MTPARDVGAPATMIPVVHAVTNDEVLSRPEFFDLACDVMRALGPRGALHLRGTLLSGARLQTLAEGLAAAQGITGAWLVVNDRVDVALASEARGAQLTTRSLTVTEARRVAPGLALGASVHDERQGLAAAASGADWLVASHRPESPGTRFDPGGTDWLERLARGTVIPVLTIGGVRADQVRSLRGLGVRGIAVIRGIWSAPNAVQAASDYLSAYDDAGDS